MFTAHRYYSIVALLGACLIQLGMGSASAQLIVTVSPTSGPTGTQAEIRVQGVEPFEELTVRVQGYEYYLSPGRGGEDFTYHQVHGSPGETIPIEVISQSGETDTADFTITGDLLPVRPGRQPVLTINRPCCRAVCPKNPAISCSVPNLSCICSAFNGDVRCTGTNFPLVVKQCNPVGPIPPLPLDNYSGLQMN